MGMVEGPKNQVSMPHLPEDRLQLLGVQGIGSSSISGKDLRIGAVKLVLDVSEPVGLVTPVISQHNPTALLWISLPRVCGHGGKRFVAELNRDTAMYPTGIHPNQ